MNYFEYYKNQFSDKDYKELLEALDRPFRKSIRVNTIKISVDEFKNLAEGRGWKLERVPWCREGFFIDRDDKSIALGKDPMHLAGLFYIQEASSMLPPETTTVSKEDKFIIDLAAAPGSKFTQISAKAKENEIVFGNEPSGERIKGLVSNIIRLGITNSCVIKKDPAAIAKLMPNIFSKVFLDAPCSGDGMIRRDSKMLDKWSTERVKFQAGIQKRLIKEAFSMLKPGGELVYSTCTMSKEEDEEVIDYLLYEFSQAEIIDINIPYIGSENKQNLKILPQHFDTEGFFVAKIGKKDMTNPSDVFRDIKKKKHEKRWKHLLRSEIRELAKTLSEDFRYILDTERFIFVEKNDEIWIWPEIISQYIDSLAPVFTGVCLGKNTKKGFVPSHQFAMSLLDIREDYLCELNDKKIKEYYSGKDIQMNSNRLFSIATYKKYPLGLLKSVDNSLKNILPRTLVLRDL